MTKRTFFGALMATAIGLLGAAPAWAQTSPSYATPSSDERIEGTIAAVNGPYAITVRDARGYVDNVTLHQGTIINPTGLTLAAGQSVTIFGRNAGSAFAANEIDTPYSNVATLPIYPVYPAYVGYPYRAYPYRAYPYPGYHFGFGFRG